jgi:hypothetical protein
LKIDQPIDLLVVDGPPGNIQKQSRYPALPLFYRQLSDRSTIILDDGLREDEQRIVARWEREFDNLSIQFLSLEKGAYVIHKGSQRESSSHVHAPGIDDDIAGVIEPVTPGESSNRIAIPTTLSPMAAHPEAAAS